MCKSFGQNLFVSLHVISNQTPVFPLLSICHQLTIMIIDNNRSSGMLLWMTTINTTIGSNITTSTTTTTANNEQTLFGVVAYPGPPHHLSPWLRTAHCWVASTLFELGHYSYTSVYIYTKKLLALQLRSLFPFFSLSFALGAIGKCSSALLTASAAVANGLRTMIGGQLQ